MDAHLRPTPILVGREKDPGLEAELTKSIHIATIEELKI
jgi:hypothetical protein